ncbi:MAG: universal stress protein [Bacteroidales bacterium]|nr:universal stress protein [Bacteroidales bacterium]
MKKIVVAVDFSSGSIHALEYAISIANMSKSNILMIWVDKTANPDSIYASSVESYRGEVIKRFRDLIEEYQPRFTGGKLDYKLRKGKIYSEIVNTAKSKNADLIISGSHGVSGYEEFWIGSNANRVVGHAHCPVITVRNGFEIKDSLREIVVPIDHSNHTLIKIPFTAVLAKLFHAEVHIVLVFSTNLATMHKRVENYADKAKKYFDSKDVSYVVEHIQSQNATKAAIDYAKANDADLISIMTEQDERRDSGLLGPCAQQIVNHSPIPVLSVHTDDAGKTMKLFDQI